MTAAARHALRQWSAISEAQRDELCKTLAPALLPTSEHSVHTHALFRALLLRAVSGSVDFCRISSDATLAVMHDLRFKGSLRPLVPQVRTWGSCLRRVVAVHTQAHGDRCRQNLIPVEFGVPPPEPNFT